MYESTRGNLFNQTASQAIALGMVPGGGLFVPTDIPSISWEELQGKSYAELARKIMALYVPDLGEKVITQAAAVYGPDVFDGSNPAPLVNVGDFGVLELWHGPTAAFKDMALQVLPYLLSASLHRLDQASEVLILVATSGDTGKAALEGFKNVPDTNIMVFYPDGGVSPVQERQMTTTDGRNTYVVAVKGNFDQCQTAVKEIFASQNLKERLASKNAMFSSANSINWGRLLPQIVYYIWTYLQAVETGQVKPGAPMNIVVPTGNFGNILAAYYAQKMGIPFAKLICASNKNNVLTDFFTTGIYQSKRPFYLTMAPSMDILISSNFERFLYEMSGRDAAKVVSWYNDLSASGAFTADKQTLEESRAVIHAGWAEEPQVLATIGKWFNNTGYVFDPHTAVAVKVYEDYVRMTGDTTYTTVVSTASPFKFAANVLKGIIADPTEVDEWEALNQLAEKTGWEIPRGLRDLHLKAEQKVQKCEPAQIPQVLAQTFDI